MLIKNVHIDNHEETSDVRIVNGKFKEIARFYVTDDSNHIPIRLDMYLRFGSAKAYITQMKGNKTLVKTY